MHAKLSIGKLQSFLPYFLYFTKSRKKLLLGRAKSCRWQVFVRRRPPKQGELRTDVSKATMFQGDRAAKGFNFVSGKLLFGWADSRFAKPRNFSKGFNWVCTNVLSLCAESRFAEPRSFLKKVLIVAVRSCHCGALIRGLENLESPERETFLFFSLVRKEPKSTPEVCEPLDSGDDSNRRSIRCFC